ncbi:ATP-dependent DNA helicase RecG [Thalassiella azotivora]
MSAAVEQAGGRLARPLRAELGDRTAKALAKHLDLHTVGDLLRHLPRRYATGAELTDLRSLTVGEYATVLAEVVSFDSRPMRNRPGVLCDVVVTDGRDELRLAFFARRRGLDDYWRRQLPGGQRALFAGKVDAYRGRLQLVNPEFDPLPDEVGEDEARERATAIVPIYPASAAVPTWKVRQCVATVMATLREEEVPDPVPGPVLAERGLPPAAEALRLAHEPQDEEEWRRARRRFTFEEAFVLQAALARRRAAAAALPATARSAREGGLLAAFDARLPFELTAGQRAVGEQIADELAAEHPMHRLLQGEVGSGKTLVALRAMLTVVDAGGQAALLAPTEVLAVQHHRSITGMLGDLAAGGMLGGAPEATRVALLTGSQPAAARRAALLDVASGQAGIVVGTHALLQERVEFADLGLVVVDEQHRFGVEQRDALRAKASRTPHLLVMTATPIPRTVAMTVFGDLETSVLDELPRGRQPITTHVVPAGNPRWVTRTWERLREEVDAGRQAFVVCPRIGDDDEDADAAEDAGAGAGPADGDRPPPASAVGTWAALQEEHALRGVRVGLLHGRLPADEKDAVMRAFAAGEVDVLVATTVVEVGVDVPNATGMVVLDADRFGVSQLHQLRGRVGRGQHAGVCLLVTHAEPDGPAGRRLAAVAATLDGFELSQVDLEARREGDVLGARQSGARSSLRLLRVLRDADVIADARAAASAVVAGDPDLAGHPALAAAMELLLDPEREEYLERG